MPNPKQAPIDKFQCPKRNHVSVIRYSRLVFIWDLRFEIWNLWFACLPMRQGACYLVLFYNGAVAPRTRGREVERGESRRNANQPCPPRSPQVLAVRAVGGMSWRKSESRETFQTGLFRRSFHPGYLRLYLQETIFMGCQLRCFLTSRNRVAFDSSPTWIDQKETKHRFYLPTLGDLTELV